MNSKKNEVEELQTRLERKTSELDSMKDKLKNSENKKASVTKQKTALSLKNAAGQQERLNMQKEFNGIIEQYEQQIEQLNTQLAQQETDENNMGGNMEELDSPGLQPLNLGASNFEFESDDLQSSIDLIPDDEEQNDGIILNVPHQTDEDIDNIALIPSRRGSGFSNLGISKRSSFLNASKFSRLATIAAPKDVISAQKVTEEQLEQLRAIKNGKFDIETVEQLSMNTAKYIIIYEEIIEELEEQASQAEATSSEACLKLDEASTKIDGLQDQVYSKEQDIEHLVKKITDIQIENAHQMNSIISKVKSLEDRSFMSNQSDDDQSITSESSPRNQMILNQGQKGSFKKKQARQSLWGMFSTGVKKHIDMIGGKPKVRGGMHRAARGRGAARR